MSNPAQVKLSSPSLVTSGANAFNVKHYTKIKELGKGSHGVCSIVRHTTSGKNSVMKEINLTGMDEKEQLATVNESTVLCNLVHPNIVRYEGSTMVVADEPNNNNNKKQPRHSHKDATLLILMEFASGGDLYTRITRQRGRGPLSEIQVADWLLQLLLAVKQMHKQRVLHRDIKSHNVFLTGDGVIKVGDFGISRVLDHTLQNAYSFVGTPYYLSPELLQRKPYNFASDMWAVGVLLCEMMILQPPFNGHDMESLKRNILNGKFQSPSPATYSKDLRGIVASLLQQNPKARPDAHRLLHHPYLKTRLEMWFETNAALRVPKPPEWYLNELRASGSLEDVLPMAMQLGVENQHQPLFPQIHPPNQKVAAQQGGAAIVPAPPPPPPSEANHGFQRHAGHAGGPPVKLGAAGAGAAGSNVSGGGHVTALPPIATGGGLRRGRRHFVR